MSWVEKEGELLYLTDKEYTSRNWKRVMTGCRHCDPLGHTAIRRFFVFNGGVDRKVKDFWNIEKLPEEIMLKIKEFSKNFEKMFTECTDEVDLTYYIENAPKEFKDRAVKVLRERSEKTKQVIPC